MSDFPRPDRFLTYLSEARIRSLRNCIPGNSPPFVVKREKDQYIYDIDGNKYADFALRNGAVICGHNFKTLTQYIKNAISIGTSSGVINKFQYPLVKLFKTIIDFDFLSFYGNSSSAVISLVRTLRASRVAVSSSYLLELVMKSLPGITVEKAREIKEYDLLLFEPIDFDNNLGEYNYRAYRAKWKCAVENRTAFRIKNGFSTNLDDVQVILCGAVIANGMDSAAVISKINVEGENIPAYKSISILETIKYYLRENDLFKRKLKIESAGVSFQKGCIFKMEHLYKTIELLKKGIWLEGDTGFFCLAHTDNDIKRLERALNEKNMLSSANP